MDSRKLHSFLPALGALLLAAAGCSASGKSRSAQTRDVMAEFRASAVTCSQQIAATSDALGRVVENAKSDPASGYDLFVAQLETTAQSSRRVQELLRELQERCAAYFETWSKETESIGDPELKKRATERREQLMSRYARIAAATSTSSEKIAPLLARFNDLKTYFASDLTTAGITGVVDVVREVQGDAAEARTRLDAVLFELESAFDAMHVASPGGAASDVASE
jgi:flagellar motility protein MotE (MotC chaperone)